MTAKGKMPMRITGQGRNTRNEAFTLVEVVVTLALSTVMMIGIVSLFSFNFIYQNNQELRANAMDSMAREMEKLKRQFMFTIDPYTVTVADNRTPDNPYDDTSGTLTVRIYDRNDTQLTSAPINDDRYRVVMMVEWRGRGRMRANTYREQLVSFLVP